MIFALFAANVGSGVLILPYVFSICGWLLGLILLLTMGIASAESLKLIVHTAEKVKAANFSIMLDAIGGRNWEKASQYIFIIHLTGSIISY